MNIDAQPTDVTVKSPVRTYFKSRGTRIFIVALTLSILLAGAYTLFFGRSCWRVDTVFMNAIPLGQPDQWCGIDVLGRAALIIMALTVITTYSVDFLTSRLFRKQFSLISIFIITAALVHIIVLTGSKSLNLY